jgi:NAD(P)-dependent dehydrogenase (short-subunit alcohol dehydrogenase family)
MDQTTQRGTIVNAGGSGFQGVSLAEHFVAGGWRVVVLSRRPTRGAGAWSHAI